MLNCRSNGRAEIYKLKARSRTMKRGKVMRGRVLRLIRRDKWQKWAEKWDIKKTGGAKVHLNSGSLGSLDSIISNW